MTGPGTGDAAQNLIHSEGRLRALIEASSEVLYEMSPDWTEMRELSGGGFLADTTGPSRAWLMDYIPPEDQASVTAAIDEAIHDRRTFQLEHRVHRADGTIGWTLSKAIPILDPDGVIIQWFGAASDVTARKAAEARQAFLLELFDAFRTLSQPDDILATVTQLTMQQYDVDRCYYCEVDGDVVTISHDVHREGWASWAGTYSLSRAPIFDPHPLHGHPVFVPDVASSRDMDDTLKQLCLSVDIRAYIAVPVVRAQQWIGSLYLVQNVARNWTTGEIELAHELTEYTWSAVERAQAEERLRRFNAVLETKVAERTQELTDLNSELRALATASSQELTEPLRRLREFLPLLERRSVAESDEQTRRYFQLIQAEVGRAERLAKNFAMLSHLQNRALTWARIPLTPLLFQVRSDLVPAFGVHAGQWSIGELPVIEGDTMLLRQAFTEMAIHALRRVPETSVAHVDVSGILSETGAAINLTVSPVTPGGLEVNEDGLATARRIVQRHGGVLDVEVQDQGARFVMQLPSARSPVPTAL